MNSKSAISYKKRTYQLKGMSYMSLSIGYIGILIGIAVFTLGLFAYFILQGKVFCSILIALSGGGAAAYIMHIGTKHGEHGLEIVIAKAIQKKQLKNDFPTIQRRLLQRPHLIQNSTFNSKFQA